MRLTGADVDPEQADEEILDALVEASSPEEMRIEVANPHRSDVQPTSE